MCPFWGNRAFNFLTVCNDFHETILLTTSVYEIQNDDENLQNNSTPKCINIQNYSLYHSKIIHLLNFFFYAKIL